MITFRSNKERCHQRRRKREAWRTFQPERPGDPLAAGFGTLEFLDEHRLLPGVGLPRAPRRDAEVLTYVREGALAHDDSSGSSGVIQTGEFQRRTTGRGVRHSETNASRTQAAHFFQILIRPSEVELAPGFEQKRFSAAERRGVLCLIASPDGRRGSLRVHQDALVYSTLLDRGQHVVHSLVEGRCAWIHIVQGEVTLANTVLATGDGAGVTAERAASLTAREVSEVLVFDLGECRPVPGHSSQFGRRSKGTRMSG